MSAIDLAARDLDEAVRVYKEARASLAEQFAAGKLIGAAESLLEAMGYDSEPEPPLPGGITLVRAVSTCWSCPSQWDATSADGTVYYLRYRFGIGSMRRGGPGGPEVASFDTGDPLDGTISIEEFARRAGVRLALPGSRP